MDSHQRDMKVVAVAVGREMNFQSTTLTARRQPSPNFNRINLFLKKRSNNGAIIQTHKGHGEKLYAGLAIEESGAVAFSGRD